MSMDDVRTQMMRFIDSLASFHDVLDQSVMDVEKSHGRLHGLWQDEMRRDYDRAYRPLDDAMKEYVKRIGPNQREWLDDKMSHLTRYLHGR